MASSELARPLRTRGFTYVGMLVAIVLVGLGIAGGSGVLASAERRERERELLFVGAQVRSAIGSYVQAVPGAEQYPPSLDALLQDPRFPVVRRHLRRIPVDPMTGKADWVLVRSPAGGIMGLHSSSSREPLKQTGFDAADAAFEGTAERAAAAATGYQRWQFVYLPPRRR